MRGTVWILLDLGVITVGGVLAQADQPLTDPIEILKKADGASRAVNSVRYTVRFEGLLAAAARVDRIEGTVVMAGWAFDEPEKYRCDARIRRPGSEGTRHITAGYDGEVYYVIDHHTRKTYVDANPAVFGMLGRSARALMMVEFVHPSPFGDEIDGRNQELREIRRVGSEDCYAVYVDYARGAQEAVWHFATKDFLPRGVQRLFPTPSGEEAGQQWTLTNVVVDPKLEATVFKLDVPLGYERADGFAP